MSAESRRIEIHSARNNAGKITLGEDEKQRVVQNGAGAFHGMESDITSPYSRGSDSGLLSSVPLFLLSSLFFIRLFLLSPPFPLNVPRVAMRKLY